jgi:periplasmic divalent cation tolerance protein
MWFGIGCGDGNRKRNTRIMSERNSASNKDSRGIMTDKVVILVTAAKLTEGKRIARHLLDSKLAACVNILPPIRSLYRWQGKLEDAKEYLLIIKTTRELFAELKTAIAKYHSYVTPEIICLPIVDGSAEYLQWVSDSVKRIEN